MYSTGLYSVISCRSLISFIIIEFLVFFFSRQLCVCVCVWRERVLPNRGPSCPTPAPATATVTATEAAASNLQSHPQSRPSSARWDCVVEKESRVREWTFFFFISRCRERARHSLARGAGWWQINRDPAALRPKGHQSLKMLGEHSNYFDNFYCGWIFLEKKKKKKIQKFVGFAHNAAKITAPERFLLNNPRR